MATDGFILEDSCVCQNITIIASLFAKLIPRSQSKRFADLDVVLPFNPIAGGSDLRPEWEPYGSRGSRHKTPFNCAAVAPKRFRCP